MEILLSLLEKRELRPPLSERGAAELIRLSGMRVYPASIASAGGAVFFLGRRDAHKLLGILSRAGRAVGFTGEEKEIELDRQRFLLKLCPTDHANAETLRRALPYTAPKVIGLHKSFGFGDRLGLATPGHIRAVRGTNVAPVFAQQSIREMTRTQRTPEEVMDDATWGVFQGGWREGWGADADHLKTTEDIDRCAGVGFTMFTIDPSDHVDNQADSDPVDILSEKFDSLPWDDLESSPKEMREAFLGKEFDIGEGKSLSLSEEELLRAACKYGRAVAHTSRMYRHLAERMGEELFELEISVDETEAPTSMEEHLFVARELRRLGVEWMSLAPRFVGRFEKGVDYIGNLERFEEEFVRHVAAARAMGPYKLSLHSGSDKFSIYPIMAEHAGDLVHVKTAGTSYLEALRAMAEIDPALFRQILAFAFQRYGEDRVTYFVSADPEKVPPPNRLPDSELAGVLDLFDGRQLLHVTYGSVLRRFRERMLGALRAEEGKYYRMLEEHLEKHLAPFTG